MHAVCADVKKKEPQDMLITDFIETYAQDKQIRFEYCYLGLHQERIPEESLSYVGTAGAFARVMKEKAPMVFHLYATCGECNDFEVAEESDGTTVIRYIDFR